MDHADNFSLSMLTDPGCFAVNRLPAHTDFETEAGGFNSRQLLNGSWWFHYSENPDSVCWDFIRPDFDCTGWQQIRVPGHLQLQGWDRPQYVNVQYPWDGVEEVHYPDVPRRHNPVAQYVRYITLDEPAPRSFISFQGVETALALWVNGRFVGYSEDSYTPADFELTGFLHPGINKIAAAVFKFSTGSWLEDQDFWRMSGIMRDVFLYTTPENRIRDFYFVPKIDLEHRSAHVSLTVSLENPAVGEQVCCRLLDAEGRCIAEAESPARTETQLVFAARDLKLWSAEHPDLYTLAVQYLAADGSTVQAFRYPVGFRVSEIRADGLWYLNGKRLLITGVNRHDFSHANGRSVTREEMEWDVVQMKRHNINAVRTCHYPNQSWFYALCSKYGLYVLDETNLETHGTWHYGRDSLDEALPGSKPQWRDIVVDRALSMFGRDKNRTCVICWSLGNESYSGENFRAMRRAIREKDPVTPIHYEGCLSRPEFSDLTDIHCSMYTPVATLKEWLAKPEHKPYLLSEYCHAMGNSCGGLHKYIQLTRENPRFQGGFIWDFIDQSLAGRDTLGRDFPAFGGDFDDRPNDGNFCVNGLVFGDRTLSPKMQLVKNQYQPITARLENGSAFVTNRMLFTDLSEYDLRWTLLRDGKPSESRMLHASLAPGESGVILLPVLPAEEDHELVQTLSVLLARDTLWEKRGYELMAFQGRTGRWLSAAPVSLPLRTESSEYNLGVYGTGFGYLFHRGKGLVSIRFCGRELCPALPGPNFWRTPTDNDRGCGLPGQLSLWKIAGLYPQVSRFEQTVEPDRVTVRFACRLPLPGNPECELTYTVHGDGTLDVFQSLPALPGLPDLPEFSWMLPLPGSLHRLEWYGFGPDDTWEDSCQDAQLGIWRSTAAESLKPYVINQDSGNKCGVRWMTVTDDTGFGLSVSGEAPLQISALPYDPHQLEAFSRPNQLPESDRTVLRISSRKMGLGGDDSWGARPHPEYCLHTDTPQQLSFTLRPLL